MRPGASRLRVRPHPSGEDKWLSFTSLCTAKQQLEKEMTDHQLRLMSILTGRSEGWAGEKELLEGQIEDRNCAIEKLEAQSCCDACGTRAELPEAFRVRIMRYSAKLPPTNLEVERVLVTAECANCRNKCDSRQEPERSLATKEEIVRAIPKYRPSTVAGFCPSAWVTSDVVFRADSTSSKLWVFSASKMRAASAVRRMVIPVESDWSYSDLY